MRFLFCGLSVMQSVGSSLNQYKHMFLEYDEHQNIKLTEKNWNIIKRTAKTDDGVFILTFHDSGGITRSTHLIQVKNSTLITYGLMDSYNLLFRSYFIETYDIEPLRKGELNYHIESWICGRNNQKYQFINKDGKQCRAFSEKPVLDPPEAGEAKRPAGAAQTVIPQAHQIYSPGVELSEIHLEVLGRLKAAVRAVTHMHCGAKNNDIKLITEAQNLLKETADNPVIYSDDDNFTILQLTIIGEHNRLFRKLYGLPEVKRHFESMDREDTARFAHGLLWAGVRVQNYTALKFLLNRDEIKKALIPTNCGCFPVIGYAAIKLCHEEMLRFLVHRHGINVNLADAKNNITPLIFAVCYGAHLNAIKLLVKYGARFTATDNKGNTALHFAVARQDVNCIKYLNDLLRDNGSEPEKLKNADGKTPFQVSSEIVRDIVANAKTDDIKRFSEFISSLMKRDQKLAFELIEKRFPVASQQRRDILGQYTDDIFYHAIVKADIKLFDCLLDEVFECCEKKAVTLYTEPASGASDTARVFRRTNKDELQTCILSYCCVIACQNSALDMLIHLDWYPQAERIFKEERVLFHLREPDSKRPPFLPLTVVASVSKKPIDTLNQLKRLSVNLKQTSGVTNETALMTAIKMISSDSFNVIIWFIENCPEQLLMKDSNNNNVLHYLFMAKYIFPRQVIWPIISQPRFANLLYESNDKDLLPIQLIHCDLDAAENKYLRLFSSGIIEFYHSQSEIYLARLFIKTNKLTAEKLGGETKTGDNCKRLLRYSHLVDKLFELVESEQTALCECGDLAGKVKRLMSGESFKEDQKLFAEYIINEPYPSDVSQLMSNHPKLARILTVICFGQEYVIDDAETVSHDAAVIAQSRAEGEIFPLEDINPSDSERSGSIDESSAYMPVPDPINYIATVDQQN